MTRASVLILLWALLALLPAGTAHAQAPWQVVRRYLQPDARVVSETPDRMVIEAEGQRLVLGVSGGPGVDVFGALARNRDGNPYRVWRAMPRFWNDTSRPRAAWGRFLRADFLRLIRAPDPGEPDGRAWLYLPLPVPLHITMAPEAAPSLEAHTEPIP